jgi:hypothetical protein
MSSIDPKRVSYDLSVLDRCNCPCHHKPGNNPELETDKTCCSCKKCDTCGEHIKLKKFENHKAGCTKK